MIASTLISDTIPPVKSTDSAWQALAWMSELKISQLPLVDDQQFKSIITEDDILDAADLMMPIKDIMNTHYEQAYAYSNSFIYDVISTLVNYKLEIVPVLNEENKYIGLITLRDIIGQLGNLFSIHDSGGVVILEIPKNSYMLSEIGRIVESENARVLSLYLSPAPSQQAIYVTLKLNVEDLSRVLASFERFNYSVVKTYYKVEQLQDLQKNLDALMNYLDI